MFETAELGHRVSAADFRERASQLRQRLLDVQSRLRAADFPVVVLFAGVDGAGKGATVNLLCEWMDPRGIVTRAYAPPSDEERERPEFWRYWRDLPPAGQIGIFLSAWYSQPLVARAYGDITHAGLDERLDEIIAFERMLATGGAVFVKLWMHLGKRAQKKRLKALEADKAERWRVTDLDWKHWRLYDKFVAASERVVMRTSTGLAPWTIVDGQDARYRSLKAGTLLYDEIERKLGQAAVRSMPPSAAAESAADDDESGGVTGAAASADPEPLETRTILDRLDLGLALNKAAYTKRLRQGHARLNLLHREARQRQLSTILVFEGWDAAGKGGAIRRLTPALDARAYDIITIAAPTDEERVHHYLWRFWRHIPRAGRVTFFDRSWYGRVLVERVERFAADAEWRRAYAEINSFEQQLVEHGIVLIKFWLHISNDEQERRFQAREEVPYKRWKLTEEDWRNRDKWHAYERAVHDMIERTSTRIAPWVLVEGNDKRHARVKVLEQVAHVWERTLRKPPTADAIARDS